MNSAPRLVSSRSPGSSQRTTIALLLDYMSFTPGGYEFQVREAFDERCRALDVNLLLVYGRMLDPSNPRNAAHNAIFELMRGHHADGIIVLSMCLGARAGADKAAAFVKEFPPVPMCSLGVRVPGVPSVVIENRAGMEAIVEHLVEEHGCRRIAFIAGTLRNQESEARFEAYRAVLNRRGLPYDPKLVGHGDFVKWGGRQAMQDILARASDIDAIVAANDGMAVGAVEALRESGYRVPRDVAVTGFDDLDLARIVDPPLTTVSQPLAAIAAAALDLVLEQVAGKTVAEVTVVPSRMVVRRSCGCGVGRRAAPDSDRTDAALDPVAYFRDNRAHIEAALAQSHPDGVARSRKSHARLTEALEFELEGRVGALMEAVDELLDDAADSIEQQCAVHEAVVCLRDELRSIASAELEDVWFAALRRITIGIASGQVERRLELDASYVQLIRIGEQVSVALDEVSLRNTLTVSLPALGVATAFVSCFKGEARSELVPLVCVTDGRLRTDLDDAYPAQCLYPPDAYPEAHRHTSAIFPLTREAEWTGVATFEYQRGSNVYQMVRDDISAALRNVALHQEVLRKTRLHERSLQEKQATAKRIKSLNVLAGGVAHDLNNSLGPLVALPDIILRELDDVFDGETQALERARADIRSIQNASLRAVQTIKDLLTLGRQGRAAKEPLDINHVVANAVLQGAAARTQDGDTKLEMDRCSQPLTVRGSEAHLIRAVGNLIRNAVEATTGGNVVVTTERVDVSAPLNGYENVDSGRYALVTVTDDGSGIPGEQLGQIFEPFFSTKRVGEQSGSGLGLAIVHSVVKDHGGFVDVSSAQEAGTTFGLYLPLIEEAAKSPPSPSMTPRGHARILLLDDDPAQRRTAERVLAHLGYEVDSVASGNDAFAIFERAAATGDTPYDLVICDVMLNEGVDGVDVFDQIRELFPHQKGLFVSGHAPSKRAERAGAEGVGWLSKPFTAPALGLAVAEALGEGTEGPSTRGVPRLKVV